MSEGLARVEQIYKDRGQRARELNAEGKTVVGYFCCLTPVEIITAAGLVPYRIMGSMREPITLAAGYIETIACSFTRSAFDLALKGEYAFIDGYVVPHSCDNICNLYDIWMHNTSHCYAHFVNVPHTRSVPSFDFFTTELGMFKKSLERFIGREITERDLAASIRLHNEERVLIRRLYDLRKGDPPPISGVEMTKVMIALMSLPVVEAIQLLEEVIAEVEDRPAARRARRLPRLMIHGTGNDDTAFIELVEKTGADVVVDDLCFGAKPYWYDVEVTDDPLAGIARSYLEKVTCPRTYIESPGSHQEDLENRFGYISQAAQDFGVDGIILYVLRYCDIHCFDAPDLREFLQAKGLKVLDIEDEYPMSSPARLKTRLETFVEIIP